MTNCSSIGIALLIILFAPASCHTGDKNIATAVVGYIEARSK